ncbi:MAG: MFS transporter [Dehalococcoidales bacterium]|nr:MFS transporter [Dehalococcoidales bacterium]
MSQSTNEYGGREPARFSLGTFRSFKNPVFRLFYGGMLGQMASMNMQMLARSLLVFRMTGSAAVLGAMSFANAVPMISLSLFGGVIADRVQKKYVMLIGQAASAVIALSVAIPLTLGYLSADVSYNILGIVVPSWWILVLTSVAQGTVMALMMPSRQAILPEIVDDEELMNAISLNTMGMNTLRLFAPALAGFLIEAIGFEAIYYVTSGLYLTSVLFISFLPLTSTITIRGEGALDDIRQGLNYVWQETTILLVLTFSLILVVLSMPYMLLMPVFTETVLNVGAKELGILMSVSGGGAMVGSLVLASLPNKRRGMMLLASGILLGSALLAFSLTSTMNMTLVTVVFVGLGQSGQMTLGMTLVQYYVDDKYRGRVMSLLLMQFGLTSFGAFLAGVLAEEVGIQLALGGFAVVLFVLSVMALAFVSRIRKLD